MSTKAAARRSFMGQILRLDRLRDRRAAARRRVPRFEQHASSEVLSQAAAEASRPALPRPSGPHRAARSVLSAARRSVSRRARYGLVGFRSQHEAVPPRLEADWAEPRLRPAP